MLRWLKIALLLIIALFMLNTVVVAVATSNTGPVEKVALLGFGVLLVLAASQVHKIGRPQPHP